MTGMDCDWGAEREARSEEAQSRAVCNYSLEGGVRLMRVCLP